MGSCAMDEVERSSTLCVSMHVDKQRHLASLACCAASCNRQFHCNAFVQASLMLGLHGLHCLLLHTHQPCPLFLTQPK